MTGPSVLACAMGLGCVLAALAIARHGLPAYREAGRRMHDRSLPFWARVLARENRANAFGELGVACFAVVMGLGLIGLGLSGLLL